MGTTLEGQRFVGRSVLIVGASTGIGRATAERIASEGGRVGVADLDLDAAVAASADLPGKGTSASR